jgi:peroxiredoxin
MLIHSPYNQSDFKTEYLMRSIVLFLFLILSFASPLLSNEASVNLKGRIVPANISNKIVVKKYSISQNIQTPVDTILIDNRGLFRKEINLKAGIYQLDFKGLTKINIAAEPGQTVNISLEKTGEGKVDIKIWGSEDAELLYKYEQFRKGSFKKWVTSVRKKISTARKKGDAALIKNLTEKEVQRLATYTKELTDFTKKNVGNSIAIFYMAIRFNPELELAYLSERANWFLKNRPNLLITKEFSDKIERFKKLALGHIAPDFEIQSISGKKIKLSDFRKKIVLLDFWASWCPPCLAENVNYLSLYNRYQKSGFEIFGVALETNKKLWAQASKRDKIKWINTSQLKQWDSPIARTYNITAIPANFLLDKEGRIIAKNLRGPELQNKLKEIFND